MVLLKVIQYVLVVLILSLLLASVRSKARIALPGRIVEYGWPVKILLSMGLVPLAFMIRDVLSGDPKATVTDWRVPVFFALLLIPTLLEIFFRQVILTEGTVIIHSAWSRKREIPWTEITGVSYSPWMQWHSISTRGHGSFCCSDLMSGKEEFLSAIAARLSGETSARSEETGIAQTGPS